MCRALETFPPDPFQDRWTNGYILVNFRSTSGPLGIIGDHMRHHSYSLPKFARARGQTIRYIFEKQHYENNPQLRYEC